jgi:hypothetical protein
MAIRPLAGAHPALAYLNEDARFRHFELHDDGGVYAAAALAEHPDCLELHLECLRFGPATVRGMRADVEELKAMARAMGKSRIAGLRLEPGQQADPRWPKFTRLFGFTGQRVYQAAELSVEP